MAEPVDLYLNFDEAFFGANGIERRGEAASRYRALLEENREALNFRLGNRPVAEHRFLSKHFWRDLEGLIRDEFTHGDTMLPRCWIEGDRAYIAVEDLCAAAEVRALSDRQRRYITGRIHSHLARLLLPERYMPIKLDSKRPTEQALLATPVKNDICAAFGREYIQFVAALSPRNGRDAQRVYEVIGDEGEAVFNFWTLAPYVHLNLKQQGLTPQDSMAKLFDTIRAARKRKQDTQEAYTVFDYYGSLPHFRKALGFDERMPTHLYAYLEARLLIDSLLLHR